MRQRGMRLLLAALLIAIGCSKTPAPSATAERDRLLQRILAGSRESTGADAGALYLVGEKPIDPNSVAGYVAQSGLVVNLEDVDQVPPGFPFLVGRSSEQQSGYRTKSLLVVPIKDRTDKVLGVIQLINKKRNPATVLPSALTEDQIVPFTVADEQLVQALASQAAAILISPPGPNSKHGG